MLHTHWFLHWKVFSSRNFENLVSGLFFKNQKWTATAASFDSVLEVTVSLTLSLGPSSFPWRVVCINYGSGVQKFWIFCTQTQVELRIVCRFWKLSQEQVPWWFLKSQVNSQRQRQPIYFPNGKSSVPSIWERCHLTEVPLTSQGTLFAAFS